MQFVPSRLERQLLNDTLSYYDANATALAVRYEGADVGTLWTEMASAFPTGAKVLELGCGSGRDAAYLMRRGFDVTAADGSDAMLKEAVTHHAELAGHVRQIILPAPFPFGDAVFDGVLLVATLMHFTRDAAAVILAECARVLVPEGTLFVSVPSRRDDLTTKDRDITGRLFRMDTGPGWQRLFAATGFVTRRLTESTDGLGRDSVRWSTFVLRKQELRS